MDSSNTTPGIPATIAPATPFLSSSSDAAGKSDLNAPTPVTARTPGGAIDKAANGEAAKETAVDRGMPRVATSARDAVKNGVAMASSSIGDSLQHGASKGDDIRDEWIESAREAIRTRPFAALAGALVIGAAFSSIRSPRRV